MKILIVNSIGIQVVSAIRSLGKAGHQVYIAIPTSRKKRMVRKVGGFLYPRDLKGVFHISLATSKDFEHDLIKLLKDSEYNVILPFGFETTVAISTIKDKVLRYTNTSVADFDLMQRVHNKEALNLFLDNNSFVVPKIYKVDNLANQKINYPVVVKARKGCGIAKGVRYASNSVELKEAYKEISGQESSNTDISDYSRPMIQEYIPGKIYDGCFVCNHGDVVASLLQIRETTYPLSGGVGAIVITIKDDVLMKYCSQILHSLKWHGPCQVEVKKDSRTGEYKLLEINPKLWGTLGASIHAGVDFSLKACEVAMNQINIHKKYEIGLIYKILFPLEIYTIYQDKGNRFKRIIKLFQIFQSNVKTEFCFRDLGPNVLNIIATMHTLVFRRKEILPKGKNFYNES